jgi:hypothetical protein
MTAIGTVMTSVATMTSLTMMARFDGSFDYAGQFDYGGQFDHVGQSKLLWPVCGQLYSIIGGVNR